MQRIGFTLGVAVLALAGALGSMQAFSNHEAVVRINVPIHQQGPETLRLNRLAHRYGHLDLDRYRLHSVVVNSGPFSQGYASLLVGKHQSGRVRLRSRGQVRIPAPTYGHDDWRLRLGPGSQVRMVTLVLEPRRPAIANYRSVPYQPLRLNRHARSSYAHTHAPGYQHGHDRPDRGHDGRTRDRDGARHEAHRHDDQHGDRDNGDRNRRDEQRDQAGRSEQPRHDSDGSRKVHLRLRTHTG